MNKHLFKLSLFLFLAILVWGFYDLFPAHAALMQDLKTDFNNTGDTSGVHQLLNFNCPTQFTGTGCTPISTTNYFNNGTMASATFLMVGLHSGDRVDIQLNGSVHGGYADSGYFSLPTTPSYINFFFSTATFSNTFEKLWFTFNFSSVNMSTSGVIYGSQSTSTSGNIAVNGIASADAFDSGGVSPEKAFDNDTGTWWGHGGVPAWLEYDLGYSTVVNQVDVMPYVDGGGKYFKDFTFSGSNDNVNFYVLTSSSSGNLTVDNNVFENFAFSNSVPYRYYRLDMTSGWNNNNINIREMNIDGVSNTAIENYPFGNFDANATSTIPDIYFITDFATSTGGGGGGGGSSNGSSSVAITVFPTTSTSPFTNGYTNWGIDFTTPDETNGYQIEIYVGDSSTQPVGIVGQNAYVVGSIATAAISITNIGGYIPNQPYLFQARLYSSSSVLLATSTIYTYTPNTGHTVNNVRFGLIATSTCLGFDIFSSSSISSITCNVGNFIKGLWNDVLDLADTTITGLGILVKATFPVNIFVHITNDVVAARNNVPTSTPEIVLHSNKPEVFGGRSFDILTSDTAATVQAHLGFDFQALFVKVLYVITGIIILLSIAVILNHLKNDRENNV